MNTNRILECIFIKKVFINIVFGMHFYADINEIRISRCIILYKSIQIMFWDVFQMKVDKNHILGCIWGVLAGVVEAKIAARA